MVRGESLYLESALAESSPSRLTRGHVYQVDDRPEIHPRYARDTPEIHSRHLVGAAVLRIERDGDSDARARARRVADVGVEAREGHA